MKEFNLLKKIFKKYPQIKLAYIFGSRAKNEEGPLSDYDFAVYLDVVEKNQATDIQAQLLVQLTKLLKTDAVDIVAINLNDNPVLKYQILKEGELIYEQEPYRLLAEPMILNEYFDFMLELKKNQLRA